LNFNINPDTAVFSLNQHCPVLFEIIGVDIGKIVSVDIAFFSKALTPAGELEMAGRTPENSRPRGRLASGSVRARFLV